MKCLSSYIYIVLCFFLEMEDDLFSPSPEPLPERAFSTQLDDHGQ